MKQFDPPLKVGDRVQMHFKPCPIVVIVESGKTICKGHQMSDGSGWTLLPNGENRTWHRLPVPPLAVGDEVVIIERRSGIVREVSGETALVDIGSGYWPPNYKPIELSAEGREWERAKE